jgi:hypothetical protein
MVMGNVSLVVGLLLWNFVHPSNSAERNWLHGVCGVMLGASIGINLFALRLARRCGRSEGPRETGLVPLE